MKDKPNNISNQRSTTGNESGVLNNDPNVSPFQKLVNSLDWIKKKEASQTSGGQKFVGVVLHAEKIPILKFIEKYPEETSFYRSVFQKEGGVIEPKKDSSIIKAHCYIPEISGVLPFPDYKVLNKYLDLYHEVDQPTRDVEGETAKEYEKRWNDWITESNKQIEKIKIPLKEQLDIVIMHPVFYQYSESTPEPGLFEFIEVGYTGDFDTMHTGVIHKSYGEFWSG